MDERKVKSEPSVAPRSSIRRTHTTRVPYSRQSPSSGRPTSARNGLYRVQQLIRSAEERQRHQSSRSPHAVVAERRRLSNQIRMECRDLYVESLSGATDVDVRTLALSARDAEASRLEIEDIQLLERTFSYANLPLLPEPYHSPYASQLPTVPEARDYSSSADIEQHLNHPALPHYHPNIEYSRYSSIYSGGIGPIQRTTLTPGFAPAHPHSPQSERQASISPNSETSGSAQRELQSEDTAASNLSELPPLRRMGRRDISERQDEAATESSGRIIGFADGLGDRERSIGPEDTWQTFLTTIPLDERTPSAASSFTSAMASASASNLDSNAPSSATSLAEPTITEHECDESATDGDSSDEEAIVDPPLEAPITQHHSSRHHSRLWLSTIRSRSGNLHHNAEITDELDDMQRIIAGLAQRSDIPDDWWAGAGLYRHLPRRYHD